jgi:hypothetical protein
MIKKRRMIKQKKSYPQKLEELSSISDSIPSLQILFQINDSKSEPKDKKKS